MATVPSDVPSTERCLREPSIGGKVLQPFRCNRPLVALADPKQKLSEVSLEAADLAVPQSRLPVDVKLLFATAERTRGDYGVSLCFVNRTPWHLDRLRQSWSAAITRCFPCRHLGLLNAPVASQEADRLVS